MRTDAYQLANGEWLTKVTVSRRNLLTLLAKLDGHPSDSACSIECPNMYPYTLLVAEEDDVHYSHLSRGEEVDRPGRMHPDTEAAVSAAQPA